MLRIFQKQEVAQTNSSSSPFNRVDYYADLETAFRLRKGNNVVIPNSDKKHNAVVMQFMLDKCSKIEMFCEKMSVFRNKFYEGEDELKDKTCESLQRFLTKKGKKNKLSIILAQEGEIDDFILGELKPHIDSGRLEIKEVSRKYSSVRDLNHFAVGTASDGTSIVRMEIDTKKHAAFCVVNNDNVHDNCYEIYGKLDSIAKPQSYSK